MGNYKESMNARNAIKNKYGICCALCEDLDLDEVLKKWSGDKYKCSRTGYWSGLKENNSCCTPISADPRYGRDFTDVYYMMTGNRSDYFILTVICEVLGIDQNHGLYQEIKTLIQLVRQDSTTEKEAVGYDTFGPEIAVNLLNDPNVVELCKSLLANYLTRAFILIKENKQEEAIQVYKDMVTFLFIRYRNAEDYSNLISGESFENKKVLIRK